MALQSSTFALAPFQSCDYEGGTETDVVWLTTNLPAGVRGRTSCNDHHFPSGDCDQAYVKIDLAEIVAQGGPTEYNETKTACHELGHTVGLTHHENGTDWGCMVKGVVSSDVKWRRYVTHHKSTHINAWFG